MAGVSTVFHLACLGVRHSIHAPAENHEVNAGGTLQLLIEARAAHDDGVAVTELDTSWLGVLAEEAVIEARIETGQQEAQSEHIADQIGKVRAALRNAGYEPALRIEDVEYSGEGGAPLVWTPLHPADT